MYAYSLSMWQPAKLLQIVPLVDQYMIRRGFEIDPINWYLLVFVIEFDLIRHENKFKII